MQIRLATRDDADVLIEFTSAMALETEDKQLLPEVIGAGVRRLLENAGSGFYVIAESGARAAGARRAQAAYRALGMNETRYCVFEELNAGVRFFK